MQVQLFNNITRAITKPTRVKIPYSLFSVEEEDNTICLFCRSSDKEMIAAYLEKNPIEGLTKVVSINDAKKHYVQIKDKKSLLKEHTHFICDSRVAGQLYNILGSTFSSRNDYPVQINFTNPAQLPGLVKKVIGSTYFHMGGKNVSIRLGHTAMKPSDVAENILEGVPFAIEKLQNGWNDVQSIHLKTSDSASLPIYSKVPSEMLNYVAEKAAVMPATSTTPSSSTPAASATPGKGKKAAVEAEKTPAKAAAADPTAVTTASKKRKAVVESITTPAAAPSAVTVEAPTSVVKSAKKAKKSVAETATATPARSAAAADPVSAPADVATPEAVAAKSAVKAAKKTPGKAVKIVEEPTEVVEIPAVSAKKGKAAVSAEEVEETPRKSGRRTPAKEVETAAAVTPSARTAPKRGASAKK